MKKKWYIYTTGYYSALIKGELLRFVTTWTDLEGIKQNEISQTEKAKYCMISLICEILKSETYKKQRENGGYYEQTRLMVFKATALI